MKRSIQSADSVIRPLAGLGLALALGPDVVEHACSIEIEGSVDDVIQAFSTRDAQHLTGLSARRLQYWDETAFIRPSVAARGGRGAPRLYSFRDVVQLRVAADLRNMLSLQALRRLKDALDVDEPFAVVRFGVLEGTEVVYQGPTGQSEDARRPGQMILTTFNVPLEAIRGDLRRRIDKLRQRRGVGKIAPARGVTGGQPVVSGTRISPKAIQRMLAAGWTKQRILKEFPELRAGDIAAAAKFDKRRTAAG